MNFPANLKYRTTDEWVRIEDDIAVIGITDRAQDHLSDVVFVEIVVAVDDEVSKDDVGATIESVKAAADVNIPVSGTVTEINEGLADTPETVNSDPYGAAWMLKIKMSSPSELDDLLSADDYKALED
ncbi:MAG: glycine cleavage system protein GcvH [Anaerolineaceae bacterium]|nr:glycine cleavage system protein GcvH [Anaerolineaceae bacterium]